MVPVLTEKYRCNPGSGTPPILVLYLLRVAAFTVWTLATIWPKNGLNHSVNVCSSGNRIAKSTRQVPMRWERTAPLLLISKNKLGLTLILPNFLGEGTV